MIRLWIGTALAFLDVVSVGYTVEQGSLGVAAAVWFASTLTVCPWASKLAERLICGDEK